MDKINLKSLDLLGILTILFTIKGLGGSFNTFLNPPFVGGVIGILMIAYLLKFSNADLISKKESEDLPVWFYVLFSILILLGTWIRIKRMQAMPIDEGRADMLVTITSQIQDFLKGLDPYTPYTTGQGRLLQRFYLPLVWLCYTPFYLLGIDIRVFNILSQIVFLVLLLSAFNRKNPLVFLFLVGIYLFSKQKIVEIIDVQTATFWLFYSLCLWSEIKNKQYLNFIFIPLVLLSRHPAILLFLPFFFLLLLKDKKRLMKILLSSLGIASLLIFPFMKNPWNIIESILFYSGGLESSPISVTSSFYGLSSVLQKLSITAMQKPLQVSGLVLGLIIIFFRKNKLSTLQTLALGGVAYVSFMLFVSSTPQYIWAEPLILIYFLVNCTIPDTIKPHA